MSGFEYSYDILWSPQAAGFVEGDIGDRSPGEYVQDLISDLHRRPMFAALVEAAGEVEPYDRVLGFDEDTPTGMTFTTGGIIAVRLADYYLTGSQRQAISRYETGIAVSYEVEQPGFAEIQDSSGTAHMELAAEGWRLAEPAFGGLFDAWEDDICPDVAKQMYLRNGFGYLIYIASQLHQEQLRAELEDAATLAEFDSIDWEDELAKLTNGQLPGDAPREW